LRLTVDVRKPRVDVSNHMNTTKEVRFFIKLIDLDFIWFLGRILDIIGIVEDHVSGIPTLSANHISTTSHKSYVPWLGTLSLHLTKL